ncbi:hypothetical protein B0H12DRAFT_1069582 [Mycena haematopus]|nr:hypothetical protein B0H12DRAFT_1069582 [Mycena haematopus]
MSVLSCHCTIYIIVRKSINTIISSMPTNLLRLSQTGTFSVNQPNWQMGSVSIALVSRSNHTELTAPTSLVPKTTCTKGESTAEILTPGMGGGVPKEPLKNFLTYISNVLSESPLESNPKTLAGSAPSSSYQILKYMGRITYYLQ